MASRASQNVNGKYASEKLGPPQAIRPVPGTFPIGAGAVFRVVIGQGYDTRSQFRIRCVDPVEPNGVHSSRWYKNGKFGKKVEGFEDHPGRSVSPGSLELEYHLSISPALETTVGQGRAEKVASDSFQTFPVFPDAGSGMHVHQSLWNAGKPLFHDNKR